MTFPSRHRADPRWATRLMRWGAVLLIAAAVVAVLLTVLGGHASATPGSGGPEVVPGAACVGQEGQHGTKNGKPYVCVQKRGETCAHWHRVIVPGEPTGSWSPRPVGPCPTCSPSPSVSASPSPSKSVSASPSISASPSPSAPASSPAASTPPVTASASVPPAGGGGGGGSLPVTGAAVTALVALAVLLLAAGVGLRRAGRRLTPPDAA